MTWVTLKIVALVANLRVSLEQEHAGLDNTDHNETGYNL